MSLTETKGALMSGTIIANLGGLGAIVPVLIQEWQAGNIDSTIKLVISAAASILAIWRRIKATKQIAGIV